MKIDSHVHFWNYNKERDVWMKDMKLLQMDYLPVDLDHVLHDNGIQGCIAVQAEQSESETEFLVSLADKYPIIKGVVGWIDLQRPDLEERLLFFSERKIIKGWRHIVQGEPVGFMEGNSFRNGISLLQQFGFTYDILIFDHQLKDALNIIEQFPTQKFVIDHCAKPGVASGNIAEWKSMVHQLAKFPRVYCKLSGLMTEANWNAWDKNDFYPYFDVIFEVFGTNRIMYGSDWPVMLVSGAYEQWRDLVEGYMSDFSYDEKNAVMGGNTSGFYGLD